MPDHQAWTDVLHNSSSLDRRVTQFLTSIQARASLTSSWGKLVLRFLDKTAEGASAEGAPAEGDNQNRSCATGGWISEQQTEQTELKAKCSESNIKKYNSLVEALATYPATSPLSKVGSIADISVTQEAELFGLDNMAKLAEHVFTAQEGLDKLRRQAMKDKMIDWTKFLNEIDCNSPKDSNFKRTSEAKLKEIEGELAKLTEIEEQSSEPCANRWYQTPEARTTAAKTTVIAKEKTLNRIKTAIVKKMKNPDRADTFDRYRRSTTSRLRVTAGEKKVLQEVVSAGLAFFTRDSHEDGIQTMRELVTFAQAKTGFQRDKQFLTKLQRVRLQDQKWTCEDKEKLRRIQKPLGETLRKHQLFSMDDALDALKMHQLKTNDRKCVQPDSFFEMTQSLIQVLLSGRLWL